MAAILRPATQADIDEVEANLREGDRAECDIHGPHEAWHARLGDYEQCWAIESRSKLIGYCGVMIQPGETALSNKRWLCFLSTRAADTMKVSFVRESRAVLKEIVERTPDHVAQFLSMPMSTYRGSIIWHERVLRMHKVSTFMVAGHEHTMYTIGRKEAMI